MPPYLDIYVAVPRTRAVLDQFLGRFADLASDLLRDDFAVQLTDTAEVVETGTLAATLAYGLANQERAFGLYFRSQQAGILDVMLYFGPQNRLLLGLSVPAYNLAGDNDAEAAQLLAALQAEFGASQGLWGFELAPADAYQALFEAA